MAGWRNSQEIQFCRCHTRKWTEKMKARLGCSMTSQGDICTLQVWRAAEVAPQGRVLRQMLMPDPWSLLARLLFTLLTGAHEAEQGTCFSLSGPSESCTRKSWKIHLSMSINSLPLKARKAGLKNQVSFCGILNFYINP